jgi:hypothetical protein
VSALVLRAERQTHKAEEIEDLIAGVQADKAEQRRKELETLYGLSHDEPVHGHRGDEKRGQREPVGGVLNRGLGRTAPARSAMR